MTYTEYITTGGERWDTIANAAYGDPMATARIIQANPHLPMYDVFPDGVRLNIPIIEPATAVTDLPPWKR